MDPILAISVGNTNTAFGVAEGDSWLLRCRVATVANRTPDDYLLLFGGLLARIGRSLEDTRRSALASVVPATTDRIVEALGSAGVSPTTVIGPHLDTGVSVRIEHPEEIGADLLANAVAAWDMARSSAIVVDFGTALSFTAVADGGELRGVSIAPGLSYAVRALAQNTAQLPSVPLVAPPSAVARNTVHAIQSGVFYGYVGLVRHLVGMMRRELPGRVEVIATGGQAGLIASAAECFSAVEPWLALDGLRIVANRIRG